MPEFAYVGYNRKGSRVSARIQATSEAEARSKLRIMGVRISSLKSGSATAALSDNPVEAFLQQVSMKLNKGRGISSGDLVVFTKQMSTLIDAGIAIVQALDMLSKQTANPSFRMLIDHIRELVESGKDFGTALEKHPEAFDTTYVALVRAGAQSGQLDVMLRKLTSYIEKGNKLKKQLMSALSYPTVVLGLALAMTVGMLLFVVPMFAKNYEEAGKKLPGLTQSVIDASHWFENNWYLLFGGCIAAISGFVYWKKTKKGRLQWDKLLLHLPVFGTLVAKISIARFTSTMATLVSSGIALPEALNICSKASGNLLVEQEINKIEDGVVKGKSLAETMAKCNLFPIMVSGMVGIGESTGRLDSMMEKVSAIYEEDVEVALAAALKMVEPLMFILVGGIVGFILLAMYLPIFDMASTAL